MIRRPPISTRTDTLFPYTTLFRSLSELAILTMAALWRAEFEWWAHYPIAIKAGISPSVAESIRRAERPEFSRPEEAVVYEFVQTLVQDRRVPDALYEHALHVLGQDRVVDLVGLAGYYTLISMTLNVFDIQPPDGEPAQFDLLDKEL